MESDLGKLFIGGISWDTDEDRLKEYFGNYGEVVEAVIMRDRTTGRARGFGFIVFSDPSVAERVIMDKHIIDGRTVEAKKAVPKDDQHIPMRSSSGATIQGSPGPARTRKIFVGGLASTVTESDFKSYFEQFGAITDVVVMYDHNTQRPRGFGFITFDSEEAVDRVLLRTFHELNGKMVEVKRAVPKELSPASAAGPTRGAVPGGGASPLMGYAYGSRGSSGLANQGYNFGPISGLGLRFEERFGQTAAAAAARGGFSPFGSSGYGLNMNLESQQGLGPSYGSNPVGNNGLGYARMLSPYYNNNNGANSSNSRYNTPIGYNVTSARTSSSVLSSAARNAWGGGGGAGAGGSHNALNPGSPGGYLSSGSGGGFGVWGGSNVISAQGGSGYGDSGSGSFGFGEGGYGRSGGAGGAQTSASSAVGYERSYNGGDVYRGGGGGGGGGSVYSGGSTWRPELDGSSSFGYGLGNIGPDVGANSSEDFIGSYSVSARQPNRGIAA